MIVQLSDDAERDLLAGIVFYDANDRPAGDYFFESLTADLRSLAVLGGVHSMRHDYHCMSASRFPYAVYYEVRSDVVLVVAILDERRNPDWIAERLRNG
ncbi:type II toxin-antitoxin system RelE/ParE family toxin [Crateriforma conspicua]|uniref:Plasmid stabilization system protein n=1 Tax=Crateriforma conspicua TaxID=2527996 RepID=A0A5C5YC25_9PLAN|nr:type II toxin-antitoxin system RelE/ParE family toxin [Crateriforma conspicua]TWT72654.1 hypothetical protein Pan14r_49740 [Crateriforma conspicua]